MRWLAPALLMLSACTASLVQNPGKEPGVVCYNASGLTNMVRARRADAEAQMTEACHGAYTVLQTEDSKDTDTVSSLNETNTFPEDYVYVTFACATATN
jgi:hypothetical protein